MKKYLFAILFLSSLQRGSAQLAPIEVADNTLKVGAFAEEQFYFGFAKGDEIIFNFSEEKGKELKEIEITRMPGSSVFMDYKTVKIENKRLKVPETGIYKFRFANSALVPRVCKINIKRIPSGESSKIFRTDVLWRNVFDTVRRMEPERYLAEKTYEPVKILQASNFVVNKNTNVQGPDAQSRITVPIELPENTVEWYYVFSSSKDNAATTNQSSGNLLSEVTRLLATGANINTIGTMLKSPSGTDVCDVYLMDENNNTIFLNKGQFRFFKEGSRQNNAAGTVRISTALLSNCFLGIKNPDANSSINVMLEAVAIVSKQEWSTRQVEKYDIKTRKEPYLAQ